MRMNFWDLYYNEIAFPNGELEEPLVQVSSLLVIEWKILEYLYYTTPIQCMYDMYIWIKFDLFVSIWEQAPLKPLVRVNLLSKLVGYGDRLINMNLKSGLLTVALLSWRLSCWRLRWFFKINTFKINTHMLYMHKVDVIQ